MRITPAELAQLPFEEVYEWMRKTIYPYILYLVRNCEDAEDAMQDTALAAWIALQAGKLRDPASRMQYIRKAATYRCWNLIRGRSRMRQSQYRYSDSTPSPEPALNAKVDLSQMVCALRPRYRDALLMPETDKIMAEHMHTSVHAITIMRSRALQQMKNEAAWMV
jgi:DNA-directed RNA polymerase specialized sigma24 family protein